MIRAFESALSRLRLLSEDLSSKENELSASVRRAEAQHNQNVASLGRKLEDAIDQFNKLDASLDTSGGAETAENGYPDANGAGAVGRGGNLALRIGERLEELERQRQRAQDAKFLIRCWFEVSDKGKLSTLEDLKRMAGGEGKVRCASIARQLLKISTRLDPDEATQMNGVSNGAAGRGPQRGKSRFPTRQIIEKFLEGLETDLLQQFDDHYRRQNFEGMKVSLGLPFIYKSAHVVLGMCNCLTRFQRWCERNGSLRQSAPVLYRQKPIGHGRYCR